MSVLFTPMKIGDVEVKNRFVHAATHENMAEPGGEVTDALLNRYRMLAKGEIGLIKPGVMSVHPLGRGPLNAIGIHRDDMVPGLRKLTETVHESGARIFFQLMHTGAQTFKDILGTTPVAPSKKLWDPMYLVRPREITEEEIHETIEAYGQAARRAVEAGADGVDVACSGGYLLGEFLSPFFNRRKDAWGGSDENRFRLMKEVVLEVRRNLPDGMPLMVKMNANDHTPRKGITTPLAKKYAGWLADLGIDALEVGSGTTSYSGFRIWRGSVPTKDIVHGVAPWQKPAAWLMFKCMEGRFDLEEGYNLEDVKAIRPAAGKVPFILVGGMRRLAHMEEVVEKGYVDFIAMCRPLIREPLLVKKFKEGAADASTCTSCNKCFAGLVGRKPIGCYS